MNTITKAARLTPEDIDAVIADEKYTKSPSGRLVICELTLLNGFVVIGQSAVISKESFDLQIGMAKARDDARRRIWELEAYLMRQRMLERGKTFGVIEWLANKLSEDEQHLLQFKVCVGRALSTMEDPPAWLMELADRMDPTMQAALQVMASRPETEKPQVA